MAETNLKIHAYDKPGGSRRQGEIDTFTVDFNPNSFAINTKVEYKQPEGKGSAGNDPTFEKIPALEFSLEFTIDGTGVAAENFAPDKRNEYKSKKKDYVKTQVRLLRDVAGIVNLNGEIHRPNYLSVLWGTFFLDCVMTGLNVTYNLFDPEGTPLRAKVNCTFLERLRPGSGGRQSRLESPDLTKHRLVREGDILPLISKREYDDAGYYIQLARINKLKNFRNIPSGVTLILPPMEQTDE